MVKDSQEGVALHFIPIAVLRNMSGEYAELKVLWVWSSPSAHL